jgi:hypothetical protein
VHVPTGIKAEATERRSQAENQRIALRRLRINLALEERASKVVGQPVSELCRQRCGGGQIQISVQHPDFPSLLAEVLDELHAVEYALRPAADRMDVTPSQITKFLKLEPRALTMVNSQRARLGQRRLR